MADIELGICKKECWCVDCTDRRCLGAGDIGADCPKWKCDHEPVLDCENCDFIKELYKEAHLSRS